MWTVKNMSFVHPLRYDPGDSVQTIALYLNKAEDGTFEVKIALSTSENAQSTVYVMSVVSMMDPVAIKARR